MKTFLRQYSKPAVSILLAMILMASTLMVGAISSGTASGKGNAADSSSITIDNAVTADADTGNSPSTIKAKKDKSLTGANAKTRTGDTYYLLCSYNSNKPTDMTNYVSSSSATFTVTPSSFGKTSWETGKNYYVGISSSTSYTNMYSQNGSSAKGTVSGPLTAGEQPYTIGGTTYHFAYFSVSNTAISSVTVSVSGGTNTTYNFSAVINSYAISYNTPSNGSFTTKPTTGTVGSTITVVATPSTGYQLSTFTVTNSSTSATISTSGSGNTRTFTMPSANVSISASFSLANYNITTSESGCTITADSTATYGSTVNFTVTPDPNYAIKTLTVKQGSTNITTTSTGENAYSFTMPAGNVTITATCTTTVGLVSFKFKSATAYVYHPFISINDGPEVEMTLGSNADLINGSKINKPWSDTGSLRYAWYTADLTGVDTSKPVTVTVRGQDTYMEATGTFTLEAGSEVFLACDNLMEGNTLVDVTNLSEAERDFYDTPLNMIDN